MVRVSLDLVPCNPSICYLSCALLVMILHGEHETKVGDHEHTTLVPHPYAGVVFPGDRILLCKGGE
jgi:hypothetical protein